MDGTILIEFILDEDGKFKNLDIEMSLSNIYDSEKIEFFTHQILERVKGFTKDVKVNEN